MDSPYGAVHAELGCSEGVDPFRAHKLVSACCMYILFFLIARLELLRAMLRTYCKPPSKLILGVGLGYNGTKLVSTATMPVP